MLNPNVFALYLFSLLDVNCIIQVLLEYLHKYDTNVELQYVEVPSFSSIKPSSFHFSYHFHLSFFRPLKLLFRQQVYKWCGEVVSTCCFPKCMLKWSKLLLWDTENNVNEHNASLHCETRCVYFIKLQPLVFDNHAEPYRVLDIFFNIMQYYKKGSFQHCLTTFFICCWLKITTTIQKSLISPSKFMTLVALRLHCLL